MFSTGDDGLLSFLASTQMVILLAVGALAFVLFAATHVMHWREDRARERER
ncbi:hypothetical protein ACFWY6_03435 [Streptomyces sp. NPDC059037]|uniref:hypothetical protein n=1 Tax=Streptomyces sp. NPDC059037 TaxID=3346710 RepID=UPI003690D533